MLGYKLASGIRSITIADGHLMLNGRPLSLRGVGIHEDDPQTGFAIDSARRTQIVSQAKELGATMMRAHYPLHPEMYELADRLGLLIWSEIPVYAIKTQYLKRRERAPARRARADRQHRRQPEPRLDHALVDRQRALGTAGAGAGATTSTAPCATRRRWTRHARSALAVAGYPSAGCRPQYAPLDVIGINEYFGWYPGPNGQIADRDGLSDYLDSVRACYPNKAIFVSEFGAEANRDGPVEEKGTYAYQQDFVNYHLGGAQRSPG